MRSFTFTLDHDQADKGEAVAPMLGVNLDSAPEVLSWVRELGPSNPATVALAMAWTRRNEGFWMSVNGGVVKAAEGERIRTLTAAEKAEQEAQEAAYAEGCDA